MASRGPVVEILDDDDDDDSAPAATPHALLKRSHSAVAAAAAACAVPDFLDAFSPSPPLPKRRQPASTVVLDDTPTPPKRRPSVAANWSDSVVGDTPRSFVPCSLGSRAVAVDKPSSDLPSPSHCCAANSATLGSAVPCSVGPDIAVPETPGFTSPRLADHPAVPGLPSPARKFSGVSCPISLDSDDELDHTMYKDPLTKSLSNMAKSEHVIQLRIGSCADKVDSATCVDQKDYSKLYCGRQATLSACKDNGTTSDNQSLHAHSPCEDSTLKVADHFTKKHCPQEGKKQQKKDNVLLIEEKKKKQQEDKRLKKEEKARLVEERKQKRLESKMQKEAMKAEQAEMKKLDKEKRKWESGKFASKCIVTEIDTSVIESGSVGGHLVQRFAEKGLSFRVKSNSIRGSILWRMETPNEFSQQQASASGVPYILFVFQAEEFCDLVSGGTFLEHVQKVRSQYPTFTICYVTNKLMSYIKKCEQSQYRNLPNSNSWKRPPVEEVCFQLFQFHF
ncbi:hypothetical protein ABZP36_006785 [Zizania latifolia]